MAFLETSHAPLIRPDGVKRKPLISLEEARARHEILGVAVFILKEGKIFTIEENQTNERTGKNKGDQGIFCETLRPGEIFEEAVLRSLKEEAGVPEECIGELFGIDSAALLGEGEASGVFGRGYQIELLGSEAELRGHISRGDGEINPVGFLSLKELRARKLRSATQVALKLYTPRLVMQNDSLVPLSVESLRGVH